MNTVSVPAPSADTTDPGSGDWPFDNPGNGEGTEESIPDFDNSEETEEPIETESETYIETVETESESKEEGESETETETEEDSGDNVIVGPFDDETDVGNGSGGSQAPFYIVCVALVVLSIASLLTVMIIRIKVKDELKDQELKDQ